MNNCDMRAFDQDFILRSIMGSVPTTARPNRTNEPAVEPNQRTNEPAAEPNQRQMSTDGGKTADGTAGIVHIPDEDYAKIRERIIDEFERSEPEDGDARMFETCFDEGGYVLNLGGNIGVRVTVTGDGWDMPIETWKEYAIDVAWHECIDENCDVLNDDFDEKWIR